MAKLLNETFTGTAGTPLETYNPAWAKVAGNSGTLQISSTGDRAVLLAGSNGWYYRSDVAPASADYSASADVYIPSVTAGKNIAVTIRGSTDESTGYGVRVQTGTGISLVRISAGLTSVLATKSQTFVVGDTVSVKITAAGDTLSVHVNGALAFDAITDSTIATAGRIGVRALTSSGTQLQVDNLVVEDAAVGSVAVSGSFADSLAAISFSASGSVMATGSFAAALAPVSLSAAGVVGSSVAGTFAPVLAGVSVSLAGTASDQGVFASSLTPVSMIANGMASNQGSFVASVAPVTMQTTGALAMNVTATLGAELDPLTFAAGGYVGTPPESAGFFQRLPKNPRHFLPLQ